MPCGAAAHRSRASPHPRPKTPKQQPGRVLFKPHIATGGSGGLCVPLPQTQGQLTGGEAAIEVLEPCNQLISLRPRLVSPTQSCTISRISESPFRSHFRQFHRTEHRGLMREINQSAQWNRRNSRADKAASSGVVLRHRNARGLPGRPLPTPRAKRAEGGACRPPGVISVTQATPSLS